MSSILNINNGNLSKEMVLSWENINVFMISQKQLFFSFLNRKSEINQKQIIQNGMF